LNALLVNAANEPVARARTLRAAGAALTSTLQVSATNLPAGWYALDMGGSFPTYFQVRFSEPGRRIYLPVVMRGSR
jgi:hypothetical protein